MHATLPLLRVTDFPPIRRRAIESLQVNLGYTCNQTCVHCHVNAGPNRTEQMSSETIDLVLAVVDDSRRAGATDAGRVSRSRRRARGGVAAVLLTGKRR